MNPIVFTRVRSPAVTRANLPVPAIADYLSRIRMILEIWQRRHQTSMQFAHVEARLLRDVGISDAQRFIGVNKPFWEK